MFKKVRPKSSYHDKFARPGKKRECKPHFYNNRDGFMAYGDPTNNLFNDAQNQSLDNIVTHSVMQASS